MTKLKTQKALNVIYALVLEGAQKSFLYEDKIAKIENALSIVSSRIDGDDYFNGMALRLSELLNISGILSTPSRKPEGVEEILSICQALVRHLDSRQEQIY
jgi:hypothetical protein